MGITEKQDAKMYGKRLFFHVRENLISKPHLEDKSMALV